MMGIYLITIEAEEIDKVFYYVGASKHIEDRIRAHESSSESAPSILQRKLMHHNIRYEPFWEVLDEIDDVAELSSREQKWYRLFKDNTETRENEVLINKKTPCNSAGWN